MKSNFIDDALWSEFHECSNLNNSVEHLHSQVGELKQFENEAYLTPQVAGQNTEVMEDADFTDEKSCTLLKDLITETITSSPYFVDFVDGSQLNMVNYVSEDGYGIPTAPNPTRVLNNYATLGGGFISVDDLTTTNGSYGVLPSIQETIGASIVFNGATSFGATANMCFGNSELSHWLGQHLADPLPELIDLADMNPIIDVPITQSPWKNITLVLDLDETLIHSAMTNDGADFSFSMLHGTKEYSVYVKKRPYVDFFLEKVAGMFKIVIFTASLSSYANKLLDVLDPENRLISRRFFRDSCVAIDGNYLKDLTVIEADLAKVAIIDNSSKVYQLQVNNGIPIKSWSSDPADISLLELIPFLETLALVDDVRPIIASVFGT